MLLPPTTSLLTSSSPQAFGLPDCRHGHGGGAGGNRERGSYVAPGRLLLPGPCSLPLPWLTECLVSAL